MKQFLRASPARGGKFVFWNAGLPRLHAGYTSGLIPKCTENVQVTELFSLSSLELSLQITKLNQLLKLQFRQRARR